MKKFLFTLMPLTLVVLLIYSYGFAIPPGITQNGVTTDDINTLAELNVIVADATLLDDGAIADSNAIGLATGATHSLFGVAGDDTIDEMFTAIDTAFASYSLTSAIPLDSDFTSNGLMERTGAGTYQTATSISLAFRAATAEILSRDSDAAGADDDDENALHILSNMTTTTEDSEVSDWWLESYGLPGNAGDAVVATDQRYTNIFWDGSAYTLTLGAMLRGGVTTDIAGYETIQFDFDTGTDAVIGVNSPSSATKIDWGSLGHATTGLIDLSSGTLTLAANEVVSTEIATIVDSIVWNAAGITADGTNCADAAESANVLVPQYTIVCADHADSILYGSVAMPDSWDGGTVIFSLTIAQIGASTQVVDLDFAAKCVSSDEALAVFADPATGIQAAAVTMTADNDILQADTTAITVDGTSCAGGDTLFWQGRVDDGASGAEIATAMEILSVKMEYTSNVGD